MLLTTGKAPTGCATNIAEFAHYHDAVLLYTASGNPPRTALA